MSADLEINIKTMADTYGADAVSAALGRVTEATKKVSVGASGSASEMRGLGRDVKELSHLGHDAEGILNGLSRGGLSGLAEAGTAAARVIRALTVSFGPFGWIALAIGAVAGALFALKDSAADAAKSMAGTKKESEGAATALGETKKESDLAEKSLANLAENGAKEAAAAGKELQEKYDSAARAITRAAEAANKIKQAENDHNLAQIDADEKSGKLTPAQAATARFNAGKTQAHVELMAKQKLAADQIANEDARVAAAKENVNRANTFALSLSDDQQLLLGKKSGIATDLGKIQDEARAAGNKSDDEITAAKKARADYVETGESVRDRPRIEALDNAVTEAEAAKAKSQHEYAGKVTPLAQQRDQIDSELTENAASLAKANAALETFSTTLKEVAKSANEKKQEIKQDIDTTTTVAKIQDSTANLKKPGAASRPAVGSAASPVPEEDSPSVGEAHEEVLSDMEAAFGHHSDAIVSHVKATSGHIEKISKATSEMARNAGDQARKANLALKYQQNTTGP